MLTEFDKTMLIVEKEKEEIAFAEAFYARLESYNSPSYSEDLEKALSRFIIKEGN